MTTLDFAFPLNVYARVLERLEGRVDFLHFGVFDADADADASDDRDVLRAQERASELLWQALPAPCRLLEIGIGLGTTLARLHAAGYAALGITPEPSQIAVARQRHGPRLALECARLEQFNTEAGQWDALLFQESAQYIAPFELFSAAGRLLQPGHCELIVMDEFALCRREPGHTGLHHLGEFCALAARFGWRLKRHTDLSQQVRPTLDYLIRTTRDLRQPLMAELAVGAEAMAGLDQGLMRSQALYADGVYGYALLCFERDRPPADRLVRLHDGDSGVAMRALFQRVFGHEMTAAHWAWKYGQADGQSHGQGIGLMRDGRMVAHYGGVPRRIHRGGRPELACQVCDVMVERSANAALVRKGPLHQVAATFLEAQIGWDRPHALGFGFPSERAFAVAQRMGLYGEVDKVMSLSWPAAEPAAVVVVKLTHQPLGQAGIGFSADERLRVDRLWHRMAAALSDRVLGVRDADWLQQRYLMHPSQRYELLLVRRGWLRRPVGLLVLRRHDTHLALLDMVGVPDNFGHLVQAARQRAQALNLPRVEAWMTAAQLPQMITVGAERPSVTDPKITLPCATHTAGSGADEQRGRWWLMAGDADFT